MKIIVAIAKNGVIGKNGGLPWHIKKDLAWFERQTTGKTVVMGRNSYTDIIKYTKGKPLKNRQNIVLTSQQQLLDGFLVKHSVEEILNMPNSNEFLIIGGTNIFKEFLPHVKEIIITEIKQDFLGDTYFPTWDKKNFEEIERLPNEEKGILFDFVRYQRKVV